MATLPGRGNHQTMTFRAKFTEKNRAINSSRYEILSDHEEETAGGADVESLPVDAASKSTKRQQHRRRLRSLSNDLKRAIRGRNQKGSK